MRFFKYLLFFVMLIGICTPLSSHAQNLIPDDTTIARAKVLDIVSQGEESLPSTDTETPIQTIRVEMLEGPDAGKIVEFSNDYVMLKKGDVFYLNHTIQAEGNEYFSVFEPDRVPVLAFFAILFVALVLIFGGIQGLRGLISLAGSFLVILFVLLPGILHGYSPLLVSIGVSSLIIILGSYITHGFNKTTTTAVIGMIVTVIVTGIMAYIAVHQSRLTGATSDEAVYLNLNTRGTIDLVGLLMGGIMIGLLGILYDVSIGQSIAVEELHKVAPHIPRWKIYKRAIRIGREHIGALVNTLAIAYVGASLPLMLLFYSSSDSSFAMIINREVFATEILRILIGSIGLVLAVPITTLLATTMLIKKNSANLSPETIHTEEEKLRHFQHTH